MSSMSLFCSSRFYFPVISVLFVVVSAENTLAETTDADLVVVVSLSECCEDRAWIEAEQSIRAELELLEIPVRLVSSEATEDTASRAELERLTMQENAAVALRIVRPFSTDGEPRAEVELWLVDRVTGKTTFRKFNVGDTSAPDAPTIVALRTVDALRASLIELRMTTPLSDELEPSDNLEQLVMNTEVLGQEERRYLNVGVGAAALFGPGGAGVLGGFLLSATWHPFAYGALVLDIIYAPFGNEIQANGTSTDLGVLEIRGFARWHILQGRAVTPYLALGGGGAIVFAEGDHSDTGRVGYLGGRVGLDVNLGDKFRIGAAFTAGAFLPEVRLEHNRERAASLGRPIMEAVVYLEVRLP